MVNQVSIARIRLLVEPDGHSGVNSFSGPSSTTATTTTTITTSAGNEYILSLDPPDLQADEAIRRCAQYLDIDPIRRHLFGLYNTQLQLWLAPNCVLLQHTNVLDNLEFRLRFLPHTINSLKIMSLNDSNEKFSAFNYFFYQVRIDFLKSKHEKFNESKILGCMVADITRYILEHRLSPDKALDHLDFADFLPVRYRDKRKRLICFKINKIQEAINVVWLNSRQNLTYVKEQYIESIVSRKNENALLAHYGVEKYEAELESFAEGRRTHNRVEVRLFPYDQLGLSFRFINTIKGELRSWQNICGVQELCFISIQGTKVEITRKSGIPLSLKFENDLKVKSFVSLLDGYYRLTEKWAFSLCKEISSPLLAQLKTLKCHGPVGSDFAHRKLNENDSRKPGMYILRESCVYYDEFKLDLVVDDDCIKTFRISRQANEKCSLDISPDQSKEFESLADLCRQFEYRSDGTVVKLEYCLPPSEYDQPNVLLLCSDSEEHCQSTMDGDSQFPFVVPSKSLKLQKPVWKKNGRFTVRMVSLKLKNEIESNYVLRQISQPADYKPTLDRINEWINIKSDVIVKFFGITSSPLSLILEYVPYGPLDEYLKANRTQLNPSYLVEIATYAAKALYYLDEMGLVHGRIRCHQFLVHSHSDNSFKVKLSDPFGECDAYQELAWFPPEFDLNGSKKLTGLVDVWSFGTSLWEIFSYGEKPENLHVAQLCQPFACDPDLWEIIKECRYYNHEFRKKPQAIMRDIHQIFYDIYNQKYSAYTTVDFEENFVDDCNENLLSKSPRLEKSGSIFKSIMSLSKLSLDTNSTDLSRSTIRPQAIRQPDKMPEPWIIEANQLKFDHQIKMLGEGYYGEVLKATLSTVIGISENVAVKRIKNTMSADAALRDMRCEIKIMTELHHKNIVQIKGFVEEPQVMLVMEFVEFGSLVNYLKANRLERNPRSLPLLKYAADVCSGMHYLEYKNIIHRDLAARNILVVSETHVKISDFGLARSLESNENFYRIRNQARNLPIKWYAPESLRYLEFTHKSDVWSFGVCLYEIYSYGTDPAYPIPADESKMLLQLMTILDSGVRLPCPEDCPNSMYQVMSDCWKQDPADRPSFSTLQTHLDVLVNES